MKTTTSNIILLLSLLQGLYCCSLLQDYTYHITSTPNEIVETPLKLLFSSNDFHNVTYFPKSSYFKINSPITLIASQDNGSGQIIKFVSMKQYKTIETLFPIQKMGTLYQFEDNYLLTYTTENFSDMPNFDHWYPNIAKAESTCNDLVLLKEGIVIDCFDKTGSYLILYWFDITQPLQYYSVSTNIQGKLDQIDNVIYRNTGKSIELYEFSKGQIQLLSTLDEKTIQTLIKLQNFKMNIIDIISHTNGQLSLMNENGELIVLQYINNSWIFIQLIETEQRAFAYDYNINKNTYVVLQKDQIYYKHITNQEFYFQIDHSLIKQIQLTDNYILTLESEVLRQYSFSLFNQYTISISTDSVFYSHQNSDIFYLGNQTTFLKYALNDDYILTFQANQTQGDAYQTITLKQKTVPFNCQVYVLYKVVPLNSTSIFSKQNEQQAITDPLFKETKFLTFNSIFQGPNLEYEISQNENYNISIQRIQDVKYQDLTDQRVTYQKIINSPSIYEQFYLIQQESDLKTKIYYCQKDANVLLLSCPYLTNYQKMDELQNSNTQIQWLNYESLFFVYSKNNNADIFYLNYKTQKMEKLQTIQLESEIQKVVTNGELVFFSLATKQVLIYQISLYQGVNFIYQFTDVDNLYAVQDNSHFILVTQNTLILYSYQYEKFSQHWFTNLPQNDKMQIILFKTYFVLFTEISKTSQYEAFIYNYSNKMNVYLQKQLYFYEYVSINLNQIQFDTSNELIYMHAQSKYTFKEVILIYNLNSLSQGALYMILDFPSQSQITSAVKYFLINYNYTQYKYYITGIPHINVQVDQNYNQIEYSKIQSSNLKVYNMYSQIKYEQPIMFVNRGEKIFQIENSIQLTYNQTDNYTICVDLGQSWYTGQVNNITLKSNNNFILTQGLIPTKQSIKFSSEILEYDQDTIIQLIDNQLIFIKKINLEEYVYNLDQEYGNLLLVYKDLIFIEQINKDGSYSLKIIQCVNNQCQLIVEELVLTNSISKCYIDKSLIFIISGSKILIYDTHSYFNKINEYTLIQSFIFILYPFYVEILPMGNNIYHIYSLNIGCNLEMVMLDIQNSRVLNMFIDYDIKSYLHQNKQYIPDNSICPGLFLVEAKNNSFDLVIMTSYSASYRIHFKYDCSQQTFCAPTELILKQVIQQYGNWFIMPFYTSSYFNQGILSLVYQYGGRYQLLLYDLTENSNKLHPILNFASILGPDQFLLYYQVQSFVYRYNNQLYLLTSIQNKDILEQYFLQRPQLCSNKRLIEEENLSFTLNNQYNTQTIPLTVSLKQYQTIIPEENSFNYTILIIVLIIFVILIGIIGYKWYNHKKQQNRIQENRLLMA